MATPPTAYRTPMVLFIELVRALHQLAAAIPRTDPTGPFAGNWSKLAGTCAEILAAAGERGPGPIKIDRGDGRNAPPFAGGELARSPGELDARASPISPPLVVPDAPIGSSPVLPPEPAPAPDEEDPAEAVRRWMQLQPPPPLPPPDR